MPLASIPIALIGFGAVGQATARILLDTADRFHRHYNVSIIVKAIATQSHGCITTTHPDGLDLAECLRLVGQGDQLIACPGSTAVDDAFRLLEVVQGQVVAVLECVSADGPATAVLRRALEMEPACHAITASKSPVAEHYAALRDLAKARGRRFLFESSVMDGCPVFALLRQLPGLRLTRVRGILNSTTNLVLTRMEETGCDLDEAIREAQHRGIAERDPSDDIDGLDAAKKLCILATVAFGATVAPAQVPRSSVRHVTSGMIREAAERQRRLKVVCDLKRKEDGDGVDLSVNLEEVPWTHPLAQVSGVSAAVTFESDLMGPITMTQTDPTTSDTGYGLIQDLLNAVLGDGHGLDAVSGVSHA